MAVESRYLNMNQYNNTGYILPPLSGTTTTTESFIPFYGESFTAKTESGLTYIQQVNTRKRPRDTDNINPMVSCMNGGDRCGSVMFLGEDFSSQVQQQQLEMDRLIAQHTQKVRIEIEEKRKRYSRRIVAAIEEDISKRLKAKDDEIQNIAKLNWALQEKVKSLSFETQIWKDLAQSNEAQVHMLRTNLEQALAAQQFKSDEVAVIGDDVADTGSCCGSNDREKIGICKHCGEAESSVLLLPCRHLCLCTVCGSSVHACPVCKTIKTASVQVIM